MRIHFGKRIGGFYVGGSTNTKDIGKGCFTILAFPFILTYYVFVGIYYLFAWPIRLLIKLLNKK